MSLRVVIPSIRLAAGTGSIHTVCQIPVTGVYQMPWGFEHLFAVGLETLVGRIGHLDRQLLHPFGRARG